MTKWLKLFSLIRIITFFIFIIFYIQSFCVQAAVFNIVPKQGNIFPTTISGPLIKAYYTVTNSTSRVLTSSFVKYLPLNTAQVITDVTIPDLCASVFTLAPQASCTLELNITGPINANDPNPRHHLFVCLPGCPSCCTGTLFPLNVTVAAAQFIGYSIIPQTKILPLNAQQQLTVNAIYTDGSSVDVTSLVTSFSSMNPLIVSVDSSGLVTAISEGDTTLSAVINGTTVNTGVYRVRSQTAYVTNITNSSISQCQVNRITGAFSQCLNTFGYIQPESIVLNPNATLAYVSQNNTVGILVCGVDPVNGSITSCVDSSFRGSVAPQGITMNKAGTVLYISNFTTPYVTTCFINPTDGLLTGCINFTPLPSSNGATGVALDENENYAYISNDFTGVVVVCAINPIDGTILSCVDSGVPPVVNSDGLGISGQYLYVTTNSNQLIKCTINSITGLASGCVDSGAGTIFNGPQNITFNSDGILAYIPNRNDNTITRCNVNLVTGLLSGCIVVSNIGLSGPTAAYLK